MTKQSPTHGTRARGLRRALAPALAGWFLCLAAAAPASAQSQERMYFAAVDNIRQVLVQKINAETVRIDMSAWYLTEGEIVNALLAKHAQGVPIRLIGDRGSIFEIDQFTKNSFFRLADAGVPIRLRFHPTWYPEIAHWKATIFVGQNLVTFGSSNYTPFELAPVSSTNYKDETVLFTDDPVLVGAFKTKFDVMWNDTTVEPRSRISGPPYFLNFHDACKVEPGCLAEFSKLYPNPQPMIINTARLEPDNPMPPEMVWGQGPVFNDRLVQEINKTTEWIDFVIYRLTVDNITNALLAKHQAGVPLRLIIEPNEYRNKKWPEFWITHANIDKLWAAGVPIKWRTHQGLTHMKMLVTPTVATNASANLAAAWQRDHNYFVPAATKPGIYTAMRDRFQIMWNDTAGFTDFVPEPAFTPSLATPVQNAVNVPATSSLVWNRAEFAVSYDVYLGTNPSTMTKVANVPALLINDPPLTYSWTPSSPLQPGTKYYWKVVSLTNATSVRPDLARHSTTWTFTTQGNPGPPAAPANPFPADGATGVGVAPQLSWSDGTVGTTFDLAFGTVNPPPTVAAGLTSPTYIPGTLAANATYYWRVTARNSNGTVTGPMWTFTTGTVPPEVVIYAADVTKFFGGWNKVADATAAQGVALHHPDSGWSNTSAPLAAPTHYFEATFTAPAATRYRVWVRLKALNDDKFNDSVYLQFSDSVTSTGSPTYRIGSASGLFENLWTCASCQSIGWGWSRHAYWLADTGEVWFQNSGSHTIRVQTREDGVFVDQIVLSPITYASTAPGPVSNDTTIVPKPAGAEPKPPAAPATPNPDHGATDVSTAPTLTWTATGATSYDVRFGAVNPPPLVSTGQSAASYTPVTLAHNTTYFWQIVAKNADGTTTGALWTFTTVEAPAPVPPGEPGSPTPAAGASGVGITPTLTWSATSATSYDVAFGTSTSPPVVSAAQPTASFSPGTLSYGTTYYWRIVARNNDGSTTGPLWSFTTGAAPPPVPPGAPASPSPASGATGISITPTLTWTATNATSYDVSFGTSNPPPQVATGQPTASYTPGTLAHSTTYYWRVVSRNSGGTTSGPVWSFTTAAAPPQNIVIYAADVPATSVFGAWSHAADPASPGGVSLVTPDAGWAMTNAPLASPTHYVDVTFTANAGVPYTLWLRMKALDNTKWNDSVWVQFSNARVNGAPVYPINSTQGLLINLATDANASSLNNWGWQNGAYWLSQPTTVTFATSGVQTMRIQVREDGVQLDQIVLSPTTYLTAAPGSATNDSTIVPKP